MFILLSFNKIGEKRKKAKVSFKCVCVCMCEDEKMIEIIFASEMNLRKILSH